MSETTRDEGCPGCALREALHAAVTAYYEAMIARNGDYERGCAVLMRELGWISTYHLNLIVNGNRADPDMLGRIIDAMNGGSSAAADEAISDCRDFRAAAGSASGARH